ncbi:MAG: hypothetical protein LBQ09_00175, partial [Acidobacteriaceae bacterium]|nr:hypothetical protein [Acidobacteriaceae bacterium]
MSTITSFNRLARLTAQMTPHPSLLSQIATATRLSDVLPALHHHALATLGGTHSLLFEHNPRTGTLHLTSSDHLDDLTLTSDLSGTADSPLLADTCTRGTATFVSALKRQLPEVAKRLDARAALLIPIGRGHERIALLLVGFDVPPATAPAATDIADVANTFATALELFRYRAQCLHQEHVRMVIDRFTTVLADHAPIEDALTSLCTVIAQFTASTRVSVWLHDRDKRVLTRCATSETASTINPHIRADDSLAPVAVAMRHARATVWQTANETTHTITVPLRVYQRALGTLLIEGVPLDPHSEAGMLDCVDEVGRQIS